METRIAAIVVTFHPNRDELYNNVRSFIDEVDSLLIWRNSEEPMDYLSEWQEKIYFVGTGKNEYIAKPLNYALSWCLENRYDYLLTMDQDSVWENFNGFLASTKKSLDNSVAIYAPNLNNQWSCDNETIEVASVITSGSLVNVEAAKAVCGFNEYYKIYWVDGEFCYKVRRNGYRILVFTSYCLKHQLGRQTKTIFGYYTSNYSPKVYYFMFRNMFWMRREHGGSSVSVKCILYTVLYNVRGIILGESDKLKKLCSIIKGTFDGLFKCIQ